MYPIKFYSKKAHGPTVVLKDFNCISGGTDTSTGLSTGRIKENVGRPFELLLSCCKNANGNPMGNCHDFADL